MADHAFDAQAEAFRSASEEDWVTDDDLAAMAARGELTDTTRSPIVPVEDYEARSWDVGRHLSGPKSLEEAREALADRVSDPRAPDWDSSLYDDLGQG